MVRIAVFILLPALIICSNEGNIHLLEEEIAEAIRACTQNESEANVKRYSRSNRNTNYYQYPRIENNRNSNPYNHERRNTSDLKTPNNLTTITDNDLLGYEDQYENENLNNTGRSNFDYYYGNNNNTSKRRNKINEHLLNFNEEDQCLSQCVFANLHVVNSQGIPLETELWNKIQANVSFQKSRVALQDQIRSCFQERQDDSEDNGCSFSNKLERCLMLRFSDRMKKTNKRKQS